MINECSLVLDVGTLRKQTIFLATILFYLSSIIELICWSRYTGIFMVQCINNFLTLQHINFSVNSPYLTLFSNNWAIISNRNLSCKSKTVYFIDNIRQSTAHWLQQIITTFICTVSMYLALDNYRKISVASFFLLTMVLVQ